MYAPRSYLGLLAGYVDFCDNVCQSLGNAESIFVKIYLFYFAICISISQTSLAVVNI